MIFTYVPAGHKRLSIAEWFTLHAWPHHCPGDRFHLHFIIIKGGIEYRCGPAPHETAGQVSAFVYHAKPIHGAR